MSNWVVPEKPKEATWTDDQWKAIMANNKDILVAAAAGSGKTAVLVERIIQKVLSEHEPINVDELLIVTFTNASAAEMRHRIGEALEKAIDQNPASRHLRKQLSLLNKASISTLHSFCMEVIRKYYYLIDIDPNFRIADQTEIQLIRDEIMDELFEEEYGKPDNEAFFQLVDAFTNDRSDAALQEIIQNVYDFARSNPLPEQYLQTIVSMYDVSDVTRLDKLPFIQALRLDIDLQLQSAQEMLKQALKLTKLPNGPAPRAENYADDLNVLQTLITAKQDSWESLYQAMQTWSFSRAKSVKGDQFDRELTEKAQKLRDKAKKKIQDLKDELFSRKPENFLHDMEEMYPLVQTLAELVKKFSVRFQLVKREKGIVDYADLEHFCLQILKGEVNQSGIISPSEAALSYRRHFKEVFVDEYQDTNMVQETILKLVAKEEEETGNLFMVGDVKQSIYRFRLAEPNLFLDKYNRFTPDGRLTGLRIDLARNFRSRKEVLDATNYLFKQIMGVKVGEIEYDEAAELRNGAPYPENQSFPVEVILVDQTTGETDEVDQDMESDIEKVQAEFDQADLEQSQLEARIIATKIKEMIEAGFPVYNTKTKSTRPIMYRDFVILLRSMTWAPAIMEEFKQQGVPIYAELSTGYFEATEVAVMVSLLRVIDNPFQDIPLASVLRSPIVGLNEEEMAQIRIYQKRGSFWEAVTAFCMDKTLQDKEVFYERVRKFHDQLKKWRSIARQGALSELIWQLFRDTQYYDFVGGLPGGKQRQANLRALYDRARQYEQTSFRGLFRFLRFIERMIDRGDDLGAAKALGEQEDVVRIMTIHSSKGLEFPVVFMAGMARNFNMTDIRKPYMLDKDFGFAAKYVNVEKRITYPSLPQIAFKRKKKMEMLAEEMRVLYVAMTRAKEKLYLTASLKDAAKKVDEWLDTVDYPDWLLPDYKRASATSYIDWIGPALIRHRDCKELIALENERQITQEISMHPSSWEIKLINAEDINKQGILSKEEGQDYLELVQQGQKVPVTSIYGEEVTSRLSWHYPFLGAASHRSKQSVSELKRQREVMDDQSGTDIIRQFHKPILKRPKFMQEKSLSPTERGTALHMVMQHVDLSKPVTEESIRTQVNWMVVNELLTQEQAEMIDLSLIVQFFETDLGQRFFRAKAVHREVPFTLSLPAHEVYPEWNDLTERIFIQGIIDCILEDETGLILIDYKSDGITDRYKGGFEQAKTILEDRYKLQVNLYARAIEQIWKRPLTDKYLFFFDGAHVLKIEDE
ncbi:helicase-exonuclease AddAB subunit AddA [Neobacillus dielmonensis]|uniref:helicase-exonuclease AddAB subunit AddA n=1 Tax=Neobacillus dielmonensis TaxID=1347369 RepID=UPI0005A72028|nr:helicase-exonuclease AddAB subunit AddA [Neobacillus dielmonensis]